MLSGLVTACGVSHCLLITPEIRAEIETKTADIHRFGAGNAMNHADIVCLQPMNAVADHRVVGNAALEEVAVALGQNNIKTGIKLDKLPELCGLVEEIFCLPLAAHKPIVGRFSFSHESGLHINAILSHPRTYEPINPRIVGRNRRFFLGKFSGSGAIKNSLKEKLRLIDINFPDEILRKITLDVKSKQEQAPKDEMKLLFKEIKEKTAKISSGVTDKEFYEIVRDAAGVKLEKYLKIKKSKNVGLMEDLEKDTEHEVWKKKI